MSPPALNWVDRLGARFDKRGRQISPGRLYGAAKSVLWAAANRADDDGNFWMGARRWAEDAGLRDRDHLAVLVAWLVDLKVLEETQPAAGRYAAHYRFTFRDVDGLPARLPSTPPPKPDEEIEETGPHGTDWRAAIGASGRLSRPQEPRASGRQSRPQDGTPDAASGRQSRPQGLRPAESALAAGRVGASGRLSRPEPLEALEAPPTGGASSAGESDDRGGSTGKPAAARAETRTVPAPPVDGETRPAPIAVSAGSPAASGTSPPPSRRRRRKPEPRADAAALMAAMLAGDVERDQDVIDAIVRGDPLPAKAAALLARLDSAASA